MVDLLNKVHMTSFNGLLGIAIKLRGNKSILIITTFQILQKLPKMLHIFSFLKLYVI